MQYSPHPVDYRYERKFILSELTRYEIEGLVKLHPALFVEIYHPRFVNNLYLDSSDMKNYFDNMDGIQDRVKVRIRWYGDLFGVIEEPVLEIKIKKGPIGRKEKFPLIPFCLDERLQLGTIRGVLKESEIPSALRLDLTCLEFSLLNRYRRKYFQSADHRYRITIDWDMAFYRMRTSSNTFLHKSVDLMNTVLELKYDPEEDQHVDQISNHLPFRISRNSKYVNGVERLSLW